jgi:hypothetical protein
MNSCLSQFFISIELRLLGNFMFIDMNLVIGLQISKKPPTTGPIEPVLNQSKPVEHNHNIFLLCTVILHQTLTLNPNPNPNLGFKTRLRI